MSQLWTRGIRSPLIASPYSVIAPHYDQLMDHVNYASWADFIVRILNRFGNRNHRIVDGGCGTGKMVQELAKKGYRVCGFDLSLEMIRHAGGKGKLLLWKGDIKNLSLKCNWNVFLCLYDSIQYAPKTEIDTILTEVSRCLMPAGLFIFDVVTEYHVLKYWADFTETRRFRGKTVIRQSWYDKIRQIQYTEFTVTDKKNRTVYREHHKQHIYDLADMEKRIHRSDFDLLEILQDFSFKPAQNRSDRIHFVLRKEHV